MNKILKVGTGLASAVVALAMAFPVYALITNADVAANAGIQYSKLSLGGKVTSANIKDGTITGKDIKGSTIKSGDIKNETIQSEDIEDGTIAAADLAAGTLTAATLAEGLSHRPRFWTKLSLQRISWMERSSLPTSRRVE